MSQSKEDVERAERIREKYDTFRVLVIGRANSGKTTILQKICNTTEQPEIYDVKLQKIDTSTIAPSAARGLHDINNEMIFKSNPGFVFHDSRGFEAGGAKELDQVKAFIKKCSKEKKVGDQIHVIWYCIPMDDNRPFTKAEVDFFSKIGTGSVPVVAIFTKFDALDDQAFQDLEDEGSSWEDAVRDAPIRALADFEKKFLGGLYKYKYPPKYHVHLRDMNKPDQNCKELTKRTANVLGNDTLQRLFVSTQRNNLEVCVEEALKRAVMPEINAPVSSTAKLSDQCQATICEYFPHFYVSLPP